MVMSRTDDDRGVVTFERLREIVRLAPIGIGIVDRQGRAPLSNEALSRMLGYDAAEFAVLDFEEFTHPDDIARNNELFDRMMSGDLDQFEMEKRFIHKAGHIVWGRLQVSLLREDDGEPSLAIGMLQDITEEKRLREELERLAFQDPLTELANRRLFTDRVDEHLQRGRDTGGPFGALIFADLDGFKTLNDTLGHQAGDDVLRAVGQRIVGVLRPADLAGRLGGDEFAVLLEEVDDPAVALAVANRLRERIVKPLPVVGRLVIPRVSLGLTLLTAAHDADRALSEADLAMYRAKSSDDFLATFAPEMLETAMRRLEEGFVDERTAAS